MNNLYHYFNLLTNVYKQLTETAIKNDGKPLAYIDDELLAPVLEWVISKNENDIQAEKELAELEGGKHEN